MSADSPADVSQLLQAWSAGDRSALARLTPLVYEELRQIARKHMAREEPNHTLQATALVNEAYFRLVDSTRMQWRDRAHFFAMSSRLMRRILIDYSRRRNAKRGANLQRVSLDDGAMLDAGLSEDFIELDNALRKLEALDERKARIVEMRFFGGLTVEETSDALGIAPITVIREWNFAKAWLYRELSNQGSA
jgi:RNA polymerase sigma factor (TIGR02999 family)